MEDFTPQDEDAHSDQSYEQTAAKIENVLKKGFPNVSKDKTDSEEKNELADVSMLSGYQSISSDCPAWKVSILEKKNRDMEDQAKESLRHKLEEEEKWKDIPEWKRNLMKQKEKRKQEETAPLEAERKKREDEIARINRLPIWKRNLILKKRADIN